MHLQSLDAAADPDPDFGGIPLSVVFAQTEHIEALRSDRTLMLPLEPPFHMSDDDAYLVLPDDIGMEIVDIFDDSDQELLAEALRDGLCAVGALRRSPGGMSLAVDHAEPPATLIPSLSPTSQLPDARAAALVESINALPHLRCTVLSRLVDEEGLLQMRDQAEFIGKSWRVPSGKRGPVDPSYVWSRRGAEGEVTIEMALFQEHDELVAVLRPVTIVPRR